jgi:hypothetical protein
MRIDPPSDDEKTVLRRALLAAARECGIDPNKPLALGLFVTRAGIVAHEFVNDSSAPIAIATDSRIKRSVLRSASRCSLHITASATVVGSARAQHFTPSKIATDLPVPLAEPADVNKARAS